jgi:DNA (cytosine-5)-methyltransferase 1
MIGMTVCSGIGAPEVSAPWIDWRYQSEIEPFPCAVLAHRFPHAVNLGDMTRFKEWPDATVDVLCGGTPCQSFSVAGLRKGLDDPRGNLMLTYLAIADRYRPRWIVWENVPGVLSSNGGRDFGTFLGALGQLGYGFAYRVLDAQYARTREFPRAVPQRRRRVFVVGYLGDWRRAAAVLFDGESLRGHPPPRREAGQGSARGAASGVAIRGREGGGTAELTGDIATALRASQGGGDKPHVLAQTAPTIPSRSSAGGGLGTDFDCDGGLIAHDVAPTLNAHFGDKMGLENQHINGGCGHFVAHALRGEGFDASEDGTGRGTPLVPVAFSSKDYGADAETNLSPTLRAGGHDKSHANAGVPPAIALHSRQDPDISGAVTHPLGSKDNGMAVAFAENQRGELRTSDVSLQLTVGGGKPGQGYPAVMTPWAVRRLTPTECERLMGFPDGWTRIPYRGKAADACPDGPRYKALGNSWAVNCGQLVFDRLRMVEETWP